jgi:hypothetical protein
MLCPGPLLVFPAYFLITRGLQRGMVATLAAMGFLLAMFAVSFVEVAALILIFG